MLGVDPTELGRFSKLFDDARRCYESVMERRAGDTELDRSSYDAADLANLTSALGILENLRETLEHKPDRVQWLLHLAGVEWQRALVLFALGRFQEASVANGCMQALIPEVPRHMWLDNQEQQYWSNYHFLGGQLAAATGVRDAAIDAFQRSWTIDQAVGDREGQIKCARWLQMLGATPHSRSTNGIKEPSKDRDPANSPFVFVLTYLAGFYLATWWAVVLLRTDLNASWTVVADGSRRMQAVLIAAPAVAALIAMALSAALLMSGHVRPGWQAFRKVCINFMLSTMVVFAALALTVVGQATAETWIRNIGRSFYPVYFVVAPVAGCAGASFWLAALRVRRKRAASM